MTPEIYENNRNHLIKVIQKILQSCTDLDADTMTELQKTEDKLKRNSFEIVLVGEFQGGKSTTFNTVCDGRDISPRGIGIKTSACKVSAVSLPENQEEFAEIRWKSDIELFMTMYDIIKNNIADQSDRDSFEKKCIDKTGNFIGTLTDPEIFRTAKGCIDKEWQIYNSNRANYDPQDTGKLDLLQISTLILHFFNDSGLIKMREQCRIEVAELGNLVAFPRDWAIRWEEGGQNTQFQLNEICFVFLASTLCHIHCKNLERLGCTVTDCPGLFAGPWDTAIAQTAMREADAILYLIGGDRTITANDLKALNQILLSKQEHKLFFAINAKRDMETIKGSLRPTDAAAIKARGFELASEETIFIFHARLAFNAKGRDTAQDNWRREVRTDISNFLLLDPYDERDQEKTKKLLGNPADICQISGFHDLITAIEIAIINRRFKSILIDGGAKKAESALKLLSGSLTQKENAARKSVEETVAEAEAARKALSDFQDKVKELVEGRLGNEKLTQALCYNFVDEVFTQNAARIADGVTDKIKILFSNSSTLISLVYDIAKQKAASWIGTANFDQEKSKISQLIGSYVEDSINEVTIPAVDGWWSNLQQGANMAFESSYVLELENIEMRIRRLWDDEYSGGRTLLSGLSLNPDWTPTVEGFDISQSSVGEDLNVTGEICKTLGRRIGTTITAVIVGIITVIIADIFVGGILLTLVGLGPGLIALIIVGGAAGVSFKEWIDEKLNAGLDRVFRAPLQLKISEHFNSPSVHNELMALAKQEIVDKIVQSLQKACYNSLRKQKQLFEARVSETENFKRKAADEQKRIADHCKVVREQQIDPATQTIKQFSEGLQQYFVK